MDGGVIAVVEATLIGMGLPTWLMAPLCGALVGLVVRLAARVLLRFGARWQPEGHVDGDTVINLGGEFAGIESPITSILLWLLSGVVVFLCSWGLLYLVVEALQALLPWGSTRVVPRSDTWFLFAIVVGVFGGGALYQPLARLFFGRRYRDYKAAYLRRAEELGKRSEIDAMNGTGHALVAVAGVLVAGLLLLTVRYAIATPKALVVKPSAWSAAESRPYEDIERITTRPGKKGPCYTVWFDDGTQWAAPRWFDDREEVGALVRYLSVRTGHAVEQGS